MLKIQSFVSTTLTLFSSFNQSSLRRVKSPSGPTGTGLISALSQPNLAPNAAANPAALHAQNGLPEIAPSQGAGAMQPVRSSKAHFAALHGMNIPFSGSATVQVSYKWKCF